MMLGSIKIKALWLSFAIFCIGFSTAAVSAQPTYSKPASPTPTPFYQPIVVQPTVAPTPGVTRTGSSAPTRADIVNPANSEMSIPGNSGVLIETLEGKVVTDSFSNYAFNPASNVKVATAYAVLKTFGPEYRFATNVFTDGVIDTATGVLTGNVYVSGRDPYFTLEHGVAIAQTLNKLGVRQVTGDLIVTNSFVMALNPSFQRSAEILYATLDAGKRSASATRAWQEYLASSGKFNQITGIPSVTFTGALYVDIIPSNSRLLFAHESAPLKEIVKTMMCFSNNFLSEKLGDMLGGAYAVARTVQVNAGVSPQEFSLQTSSGLGINRVTPRAHMRLLRTFRDELARYKMTFGDVMPVAGIDPGTLRNRFTTYPQLGSVVGKTGTLGNTDGGVSSLSGEMQTKSGKLLFVIFNQKGSANRFRPFQNSYVTMIQNQLGGAAPLGYATPTLSVRLANTRIVYPSTRASLN